MGATKKVTGLGKNEDLWANRESIIRGNDLRAGHRCRSEAQNDSRRPALDARAADSVERGAVGDRLAALGFLVLLLGFAAAEAGSFEGGHHGLVGGRITIEVDHGGLGVVIDVDFGDSRDGGKCRPHFRGATVASGHSGNFEGDDRGFRGGDRVLS